MKYSTLETLYALFLQHPQVCTDTRAIVPGSIYFALKGANFDGNRFAPDALVAGCAVAVSDNEEIAAQDSRIHLVPDVLTTLQQLAAHHRRILGLPVIEITGTNGKTTTKELCAAVLGRKYNVLYTEGNLNNHIGVPRTLLRLNAEHEIAVIETGANHPGEIRDLAAIVQPDAGLITNVGMAHIEGFGSFEGVVSTKCELYAQLLKTGGEVFLHLDDKILRQRAEGMTQHTYGSPQSGAYVQGEAVAGEAFLRLRWRAGQGPWHDTPLQLIGDYNAPNALAAIAVGVRYGVPEADIEEALAAYKPTNNRSELRRTDSNLLIVDAYNANPTSMAAALNNFATLPHPHKHVILGEMRELGEATAQAHADVVERLTTMDIESAWLVGDAFRKAAEVAKAPISGLRTFGSVEEVRTALVEDKPKDALILIKGSNGTRLFTLPELL